ncbi:MAG: D-alanyl-D-alanine carboxypeptidase [Clostridia bacterium]|nr:D-alanyl-D-alanine carboxypeptidase [Clostridia bacterium]
MQIEKQPTAKKMDGEQWFVCFFLCFLIFELILIGVVLYRSLAPVATPPTQEQPSHTTDSNEEPDPPQPPLFSGGVVPSLPVSNGTVTVLGGEVTSAGAILVDSNTGAVLAEKNADVQFSPASLTKIMTLIVACESLTEADLDLRLTLTQELTDYVKNGAYEGSSCSLIDEDKYLGDSFRIRDLLYGIGVESAADCTMLVVSKVCPATTLAESEALFVEKMNQKAQALGLTNTTFDNVIGYESAGNFSTARELAVITMYAMQCDLIEHILGVQTYSYQGHYLKDGLPASYPRLYQSTLFHSRMKTYVNYMGKEFSLSTAKLLAGKTGSFGTTSFLACTLRGKESNHEFVLILGAAEKVGNLPASVGTLKDVQTIANTYVK